MLEISLIDQDLYLDARRRRDELWDALIGRLADRLTGVRDSEWGAAFHVSTEDLYEDLQFGRS